MSSDGLPEGIDDIAVSAKVMLHNAQSSHVSGYKLTLSLVDERDYKQFSSITKMRKGKAGVRYRMFLMGDAPIKVDTHFLGWTNSNTSGAKVHFELASDEDFQFFREMPQNYLWNMVLCEIDDDEKIVDQIAKESVEAKGGEKSRMAGRLCADARFQRFVAVKLNKQPGSRSTPDECANYMRARAHIASRRELDHDPDAFDRFNKWIARPFALWNG